MLRNLLNTEVVQAVEQAKDWWGAVAISYRPLIESGSIESHYADAIYHSYNTTGPYYVVGPGTAMSHARPEEGVNKPSLTLAPAPSGVNFDADKNDPVKLLTVLAATDSTSHIEAISQLAKLFDDGKDI